MRLFFIFYLVLATLTIQAQIVTIPDANFKDALLNSNCVDTNNDGFGEFDADTNNDGEIQVSEALAVSGLILFFKNITSLEGIDSFTNLELLNCGTNQISSLDLSQNTDLLYLNFGGNQISTIDLSLNQSLLELKCHANELTSLDVSQSQELYYLNCSSNQLSNIEASQNPALFWLICSYNPISEIDVSQNPVLGNLYCTNTELTSIDISQNHNLVGLWCSNNDLTSLNIANTNNTNMVRMFAQNNPNLTCIQVDNLSDVNTYCGFDDTFDGWCKDDTASYSVLCSSLGTDKPTTSDISIYPNPTISFLHIESDKKIESIEIFNSLGSRIRKNTNKDLIDVSQLETGLYFIHITINRKDFVQKFVKL